MAKKRKRQKTRVVYKTPEKIRKKVAALESREKTSQKIKGEIADLESKKSQTGKGVRGFLRKAAINKAINEKRGFLRAGEQALYAKQKTETVKSHIELEEARERLKNLKKKTQVNFESLGLTSAGTRKITFDDLYK